MPRDNITGKKSVILTPDENVTSAITDYCDSNMPKTKLFNVREIEKTKGDFIEESDAIVTMANRFDGVDFTDDESRMLFVIDLPKIVNIQEQFLTSKMGAAVLFNERIRTRIVQAVGRCTRNPSDYAVVCVLGDSIQNDLIKEENLSLFPPELRAELQFGIAQSKDYRSLNDVTVQVNDFIGRTKVWEEAENFIVKTRDKFCEEDEKEKNKYLIYDMLKKASSTEVLFVSSLWKKDYESAYAYCCSIIENLNAPSLRGYKCYWQYVAGSIAYRMYKSGKPEFQKKSTQHYRDALKAEIKVHWLLDLISQTTKEPLQEKDFYINDIIDGFENNLNMNNTSKRFTQMINEVINNLLSRDGKKFEIGHKKLGTLLGYEAYDSDANSAPDPYWILNSRLCIVAEDKCYDNLEDPIPAEHVREALTHETWLRKNEKRLEKDCTILTVFITNRTSITSDARDFADGLYYLSISDLIDFANKSVAFITKVRNTFIDIGDIEWRRKTIDEMKIFEVTPNNFLNLIKKKKLSDI